MPGAAGQKIKILKLKDIFEQKTDEEHPLSMREIMDELEKSGIFAERKSVYKDMETLREYGMDICAYKGRYYKYYLKNRLFETSDLKLLTDAVSASRVIPVRQSARIIRQLGSLTSEYRAAELKRQLYAEKSTNTEMNNITANVDAVYKAIESDSKIQFRYFDYTMHKLREFRRSGAFYVTSPWALVWNDGMYYLIGYDSKEEHIKHYRVDKMLKITVNNALRRDGAQSFADFDIKRYTRRNFGMYGGDVYDIKMRCHKSLANILIDRFGMGGVYMKPIDDEHFIAGVQAAISPVFVSWAMGFGDKLEIIEPENLINEIRSIIASLAEVYKI